MLGCECSLTKLTLTILHGSMDQCFNRIFGWGTNGCTKNIADKLVHIVATYTEFIIMTL